jgi:hypothetical protein
MTAYSQPVTLTGKFFSIHGKPLVAFVEFFPAPILTSWGEKINPGSLRGLLQAA